MARTQFDGRDVWAASANADLRGKLFYGVKITGTTGDGKIDLCTSADVPAGVLVEDGNIGDAVSMQFAGVAKILLSGTVNAGAVVKIDDAGKGNGASGNIIGIAFTGGIAGDIISVALGIAT